MVEALTQYAWHAQSQRAATFCYGACVTCYKSCVTPTTTTGLLKVTGTAVVCSHNGEIGHRLLHIIHSIQGIEMVSFS